MDGHDHLEGHVPPGMHTIRAARPISFTNLVGALPLSTLDGARLLGWSAINNTAAAALFQLFDGGSAQGQNLWNESIAASLAFGRTFGWPGIDIRSALTVVTGASMTGTVLVLEHGTYY